MAQAKSESEFLILVISRKLGQVGFTELSGGDLERSVEAYPDSQSDESGYIVGTKKYSPLTLRVPYETGKHDTFMSVLKDFCITEDNDIQVTVQPIKICPEQSPDGKARIYSRCIPSNIKFPTVKRGTSGVSMLEIVLNPSTMKFA